jgi:hypothetical protein
MTENTWQIPPQPTVGIITTVGTYEKFLPQWCISVRGLQRQPDQIVIAAQNPEAVTTITKKELPQATVLEIKEPFQFGTYLNYAVEACETEWISWIGVDDRYRPQALNGIDIIDVDIYTFGMRLTDGREWHGGDIDEALEHNPIPCGSPFRRWIWESIPFQPELTPFEDWAFWVGAQHVGAVSKKTRRIDFDYRLHEDQIVPPMEPTATKIRQWAQTLTR